MQVLVVSTSRTTRLIVAGCLARMGLTGIVDTNGSLEALQIIELKKPFDLIITDWAMDKLSGIDFLKEIKKKTQPLHTPVLVIAHILDQASAMEAIKEGASGFIMRPFRIDVLHDKIQAFLRAKSLA